MTKVKEIIKILMMTKVKEMLTAAVIPLLIFLVFSSCLGCILFTACGEVNLLFVHIWDSWCMVYFMFGIVYLVFGMVYFICTCDGVFALLCSSSK